LRGRSFARRETRTDVEFAMQMFAQAIALDPTFALAHAAMANACGTVYEWHERNSGWIEKGLAACDRALSLEPQLADALVARARLCYAQKRYDEAIQLARTAIERKPDCPGAYNVLGRAYFASGRFQDVVGLVDRAFEVIGDDYNTYIPFITATENLGQKDAANRLRERHIGVLKRQLELVPEDVRARILLASTYAWVGNQEDAIRQVDMAVALRPADANILYNAACTYAVMGMKAEALSLLKRAGAAGHLNWDWLPRDPDLACLRDDPEFLQLIAEGNRKS
jgi:tetratricopeptide (TPR) repeat protein